MLYVFPKDYRTKLAAKSFRIKVEPLFEKAKVLILVTILVLRLGLLGNNGLFYFNLCLV